MKDFITKTMEEFDKDIYACRNCGISLTNRKDWCDLGCGRDYNEMFKITNIKSFLSQALQSAYDEGKSDGLYGKFTKEFVAGIRQQVAQEIIDEIENMGKDYPGEPIDGEALQKQVKSKYLTIKE